MTQIPMGPESRWGINTKPHGAPRYHDLFITESLYVPYVLADDWGWWVQQLRAGALQFDAHCVACGKASTFKAPAPPHGGLSFENALRPGEFTRTFACQRHRHDYDFYFHIVSRWAKPGYEKAGFESVLLKVGQLPSVQDIAGAELRQFQAVLPDEDFTELNKATGLFSHGIGIGSFVYLRRIFERMLVTHRSEYEAANGSIPNWASLRVEEKIGTLRSVLPPALVANKATYGILSKGIHELSENQCKLFFPVVRAAIIMMLQQALDARVRKQQDEELKKEVARIASELR